MQLQANQIDLFHPRMTNENATVITEKLEKVQLPQKRYYRQRAHSNPLAHHTFDYPTRPTNQVWDEKYPQRGDREVEILDIGCGLGYSTSSSEGSLGIDINRHNIKKAKKLFPNKKFRHSFV